MLIDRAPRRGVPFVKQAPQSAPAVRGAFCSRVRDEFQDWDKVRFIELRTPPGVEPNAVGVIVSIEHDTEPWEPRVRVRFENDLSGWIWSHLLVRA
jgi:hypothetical protein